MTNTLSINTLANNLKQLISDLDEKELYEALMELNNDEVNNPAGEFYTTYKFLQDLRVYLQTLHFLPCFTKDTRQTREGYLKICLHFFSAFMNQIQYINWFCINGLSTFPEVLILSWYQIRLNGLRLKIKPDVKQILSKQNVQKTGG